MLPRVLGATGADGLKYSPKKWNIETVTRFNKGKVMLYFTETRILVQVHPTQMEQLVTKC